MPAFKTVQCNTYEEELLKMSFNWILWSKHLKNGKQYATYKYINF